MNSYGATVQSNARVRVGLCLEVSLEPVELRANGGDPPASKCFRQGLSLTVATVRI